MGILKGRKKAGEAERLTTGDPVVDTVSGSIMKRADKLPSTYLAHLMTGSFDEPVPEAGSARDRWIVDNVRRAFDPSRDKAITDTFSARAPAIGEALEKTVRDGAVAWIEKASNGTLMGRDLAAMVSTVRGYTANRVIDMMKPGKRLAMRVSREASSLRTLKDETIHERLSASPMSRVDPLPASGRERTDWIRERLLAEHVAARGGVMSPQAVVDAAGRSRGPVPAHALTDMPHVRESERGSVRAAVREGMQQEAGMSDPVLRSRHAGLPGIESMTIPADGRGRTQAIGHVLMAEIVRSEMRRQGMFVQPKREKEIPVEARTMVRYAPTARGLGKVERKVVEVAEPVKPVPTEKAAVPVGGDRPSAARRYNDAVRRAVGTYEF